MALSHSVRAGSDEVREKVTDICCYCANSDKIQPATDFCFECGVFGRYLCATCLKHHNLFVDHQDVNHIEGQTNSRFQKKDDELRKLNGDMKQLKAENETVNKQLKAALLDRDGRQHIAESLESQNMQISAENDKLKREKAKMEANCDALLRETNEKSQNHDRDIRTIKGNLSDVMKERDDLKTRFQKKDDELRKLNGDMKQLKAENETVNKQLKAALLDRDGRQHIAESLESQNMQISAENDKLKREKAKMEANFDALLRETNEKSQNHDRDIRTIKGNLSDVMKERDDLKTRLSKLPGAKSTDQIADIADLSDPNRAMKVSEKFGTLYDDEWTDAFEELKKKKVPVEDSVKFLLNVLQDCLKFCNNLKETQIDSLNNVLLHPSQDVKKFAMGNRKQVQLFVMETKSWDKCRYDKKLLELCEPYLQKCAEVCWLMVLHDPPLHMKVDAKSGDTFDVNLYTVYASSGEKLDYLVWPPLYNEVGGGLISKGVAECTKTIKKK